MPQIIDKIFPAVWSAFAIIIVIYFYVTGKKALQIFPPVSLIKVIYRYKFGSGYSTKTTWLNSGRASNVLDIVVTDKELWLKTMTIFAGLTQRFDLLHKVPLENITHTEIKGNKIIIDFKTEAYEDKQVVIITKNPETLLYAIRHKAVAK